MCFEFEIDEKIIMENVEKIISRSIERELENRYSGTGHTITEIVKDMVYSRKDEIIDMVVDKASREIVRKGLPKLIDIVAKDGN